jgi:hypothetical protein
LGRPPRPAVGGGRLAPPPCRRAASGPGTRHGKGQTKANDLYADAEDKAKGQERLQLYREKKPYRETNP